MSQRLEGNPVTASYISPWDKKKKKNLHLCYKKAHPCIDCNDFLKKCGCQHMVRSLSASFNLQGKFMLSLCSSCHVKQEESFTPRRFYILHPSTHTSKVKVRYDLLTITSLPPLSLVSARAHCNGRRRRKCRLLGSLEKRGFPGSRNETLVAAG